MTRASLIFGALLLVALPLSLLAGRVWIDPSATPNAALILMELRLPRGVLAMVVGAGLGGAGAAMHGYLRNPLADPGLFGIAPMAALGAVASMWFGYTTSTFLLPALALAGAGIGMALLALIAGRSGGIALFTLAGLMIASLAGALTDRSWREVWVATPLVATGLAVLGLATRSLDALTLGEAAARSLGVDARLLLWFLIAGVGLTVGASVAVAGVIGFVGLIVPHLVRPLTDRLPSSLLLPSALAGALLVLVADSVVRILPLVTELRLGIALSLIGAPFFLWLLIRMRRGLI